MNRAQQKKSQNIFHPILGFHSLQHCQSAKHSLQPISWLTDSAFPILQIVELSRKKNLAFGQLCFEFDSNIFLLLSFATLQNSFNQQNFEIFVSNFKTTVFFSFVVVVVVSLYIGSCSTCYANFCCLIFVVVDFATLASLLLSVLLILSALEKGKRKKERGGEEN